MPVQAFLSGLTLFYTQFSFQTDTPVLNKEYVQSSVIEEPTLETQGGKS